jgi:hypothetical protein
LKQDPQSEKTNLYPNKEEVFMKNKIDKLKHAENNNLIDKLLITFAFLKVIKNKEKIGRRKQF